MNYFKRIFLIFLLSFLFSTGAFGQFPFKKKASPVKWTKKILPQKDKYKIGEGIWLVMEA